MPQLKKYKIGDFVESVSITHSFPKEKIIFLNTSDILEGKVLHRNYSEVSGLPGQAKKSIKKGDILFSEIRPGNKRYAVVEDDADDYVVSTKLMVLRKKSDVVDFSFFYKWLTSESVLAEFQNIAESRSGTFPQITFDVIKNVEIDGPSEKEAQSRIASILSSLDDKIELNRRSNQTLEQIAQTLFKKYFVDDIDPESLPEGWRWGKLGEMYKTTSGGTPSRTIPEYFEGGNIGWVKSKELDGGFILDTEEKITRDALKSSSAKLLPVHSVLVAMYGATVGEIAILSIEATCNQAICAILPNEVYAYSFVFLFLQLNKEELINKASGSAQQNISQLVIQNFELAIPPSNLVKEFHAVVGNLYLSIENNLKEIEHLIKVRDSLLPKLMAGEIEVNVTEKELVK